MPDSIAATCSRSPSATSSVVARSTSSNRSSKNGSVGPGDPDYLPSRRSPRPSRNTWTASWPLSPQGSITEEPRALMAKSGSSPAGPMASTTLKPSLASSSSAAQALSFIPSSRCPRFHEDVRRATIQAARPTQSSRPMKLSTTSTAEPVVSPRPTHRCRMAAPILSRLHATRLVCWPRMSRPASTAVDTGFGWAAWTVVAHANVVPLMILTASVRKRATASTIACGVRPIRC